MELGVIFYKDATEAHLQNLQNTIQLCSEWILHQNKYSIKIEARKRVGDGEEEKKEVEGGDN